MKPPLRTKSVGTKVSEAEYAQMEKRAQAAGLRLAEWVREVLLNVPKADTQKHEAQTGEVVLAELLVLRRLFLSPSSGLARGR